MRKTGRPAEGFAKKGKFKGKPSRGESRGGGETKSRNHLDIYT